MATENVGGIQYTVDADTSDLIAAEAQTKKFTSNTAKSFSTAEASTKKFNAQVSGTAKAVRSARPDMQNMSYQLQDMAVQAQMGTSAFVIMAQQLPQMLVGMGAWAGAIGVAVTVLGLMATTMIDTTSDMEKLEKAIEQVKAIMTVGSNGIATYSDEMKKLSNISKDLLQIELNTALAAQQNAFKLAGEAAKQAYEDATPFFNLNWDAYKNQQEAVFDNIIDDKELEKLGMAHPLMDNAMNGVYGLNDALLSIKNGNLDAGISRITGSLDLLSRSAAQNTEEGKALIKSLTDIVKGYKEGKITVEQLTKAVNGNADAFKGNADALQDYLKNIELSTLAIKGNERELEKRRLELTDMTEQEQITALAAWDYMKKVESQTEAVEAAIEADKKRKKSLEDVSDSLDAYFDKESADSTKKQAREEVKAIGFAQGIVNSGKSDSELFAEEQEKLFELRQQALISQDMYDQAVVASVKKRNEQIETANKNQLDQQALFTNAQGQLLGSLGNLFGAYADNMEVQDKESFEKKKKFQTAQALINTAMAISNAHAAAPPPINYALMAAAGAMGAIQVGAIQSQQYSGAREFGGPVTAGKSYLVGERGPEMFTPGSSGGITSNKDMAGGGQMNVIINNNAPGVDVSANQVDQRTVEISVRKSMQEFANQASTGQGVAINALTRNTNVTRKGGV